MLLMVYPPVSPVAQARHENSGDKQQLGDDKSGKETGRYPRADMPGIVHEGNCAFLSVTNCSRLRQIMTPTPVMSCAELNGAVGAAATATPTRGR